MTRLVISAADNERYVNYQPKQHERQGEMSRNCQEILCEGWLTKSPPTKKLFRGRWRRRWFTLHAGELPQQFILSYYTDRNSRKLKGSIDLDHCEQVDTGLKYEVGKFKFDHLFDIRTPTRVYYLAADTESEMKTWVRCICNICGLKATSGDDDCKFEEEMPEPVAETAPPILESPPISPVSTSPYIPISECITGKTPILLNQPVKDFNTLLEQNVKSSYLRSRNYNNDTYDFQAPTYLNCDPRFYDTPRRIVWNNSHKLNNLNKQHEEPNYHNFDKNIHSSPLQSPTDSESVFTDDDWSHNTSQSEHNTRNGRLSNTSTEVDSATHKLSKLSIDATKISEISPVAPPRPPKPSHITNTSASYLNLNSAKTSKDDVSKSGNHSKTNSTSDEGQVIITDEMYDFPRSHNVEMLDMRNSLARRHCYNNAAPSLIDGQVFTYDNPSPKPSTSNAHVFRYGDEIIAEPASPLSQGSSTAQYSNLPSPLLLPDTQLMPPPKVNRGLKPKRKLSDSLSISSTTEPVSPHSAPSVDRNLKPFMNSTMPTPNRRTTMDCDNDSMRRFRTASRSSGLGRSYESLLTEDTEQIYHHFPPFNDQRKILEYLDLDLENKSSSSGNSSNTRQMKNRNDEPLRSPGAITVYKKVDFMKTEAFNITRNNLEKERNKTVPTLKK